MMHSINEIYTIHNGTNTIRYATKEYLVANNIPTPTYKEFNAMRNEGLVCARATLCHSNNSKPVKVLDVDGIKLIYLYGEKTWFDTAEELANHRAVEQAKRAASAEHNRLKKMINDRLEGMSVEQLEMLLARL
jgi:hypothetical protein